MWTPEQVEQYVLLASDASHLQHQQHANALLNHWISSTDSFELGNALIPMLRSTKQEVVLFFVLSAFLNLPTTTTEQRVRMRQELLVLLIHDNTGCWSPTYLRTKVGVLLASFIQLDFTNGNWPTAFDDLQSPELLRGAPDILLRTLVALMDDFGHNETPVNAKIKDLLRGYYSAHPIESSAPMVPPSTTTAVPPAQSVSAQLLKTIYTLLTRSLEVCNGVIPPEQLQICILSLTAIKGFMAWIDLSLVLEEEQQQNQVLNLIFMALAKGSTTDSPMADAAVMAVECLQELIARGMEEEKKVAILIHTHVLETIHANVNLETVDASPIDVVLEIAKFINRTGLEVLHVMLGETSSVGNCSSDHARVRSQLLELFFRCFAYDDIDVSGAVIPLAGSLIPAQEKSQQSISVADPVLSQLLAVTFRQMRYPEDFQFDYEDEDEAEEELYRTELRKLNQKFIRAAPEAFLQFMCQTLATLPLPLSGALTPDVEAALRLVYHYCEGIRPPPGMKVVMRNETFRNLLIALHSSDITMHPHREVLTLYYETAVRYYPLLKERPDLLQKVLESLTGVRGLQHENARVRSRCCYMLSRLVKSVGNNSNSSEPNVLRPYVETAVSGIQGLLENNAVQLRSEDTLNLFETIGLLLGKTGVEPAEQQRYLTSVMTPHIRSIEQVLERKEAVALDPETYGEILSSSIAAIAFLSKGFKRPSEPVQLVLLETLQFSTKVLETLPNVNAVRNKSMVLTQRLIQCLEDKVLPIMPRLLHLVILHCTAEDILDVAQLHSQLCMKFNDKIIPTIDAALVPFLQKCHSLAISSTSPTATPETAAAATTNPALSLTAPHQLTEQLSIQKLSYMVLNSVAVNKATGVLVTPTNLPHLEGILQSMSDGATRVEDPSMKKTCLVFFKEVLEQWIGVVGGPSINGAAPVSSPPPPPLSVVQGYIQFLCNHLIPGVLESFAQPNFSVQDANQWRCVLEFAALLDLCREGLSEVYQQQILVGVLVSRLGCPAPLVDLFRVAADRKAVETSLKTLLEHIAQQRTGSRV